MTYILSGILILANFISSILKGKGKVLFYFLVAFMWVLFWGNYDNADYSNYKNLYQYVENSGTGYVTSQIGFVLMMKFAAKLGLEYYQFLMVISFVGLYLITQTVNKYASKPQLVYLLYFIHPFLLDVVQVKQFLAMSIIIFCYKYLEGDGIRNNTKYILGVLIAYSIHPISILFLPLLFVKKIKINGIYLLVYLVLIIAIPLAYTNVFLTIGSIFVDVKRIEIYFLNRARFGFFIQFFVQGAIFLFIYYSKCILKRRKESDTMVDLIYRSNLYLIILFPLYIINGTFERGFRMIMILNYIVFSKLYSTSNKNEKVMLLISILVFVVALFLYYNLIPYRDTVFFPIFENNLLF